MKKEPKIKDAPTNFPGWLCYPLAAFLGLGLLAGGCARLPVTGLHCENLRCEYLNDPRGIDATSPRLSWIVASSRRGEKQTAYQILAASSANLLDHNIADLWDSGRVASDQTSQVVYSGKPLVSRQGCFWKVRAWDRDGHPGAWSHPAAWQMGLLAPEDWSARWIGAAGGDASPLRPWSFAMRPMKRLTGAPAPM